MNLTFDGKIQTIRGLIRRLPASVCLLIVGCTAATRVPEPMIDDVWFNQALLRETVPSLSQDSGAIVELTGDVDRILNLYVNLDMPGPQKLSDVLNAIVAFIEVEHQVRLEVVRESPRKFLIVKAPDQPLQTVP